MKVGIREAFRALIADISSWWPGVVRAAVRHNEHADRLMAIKGFSRLTANDVLRKAGLVAQGSRFTDDEAKGFFVSRVGDGRSIEEAFKDLADEAFPAAVGRERRSQKDSRTGRG